MAGMERGGQDGSAAPLAVHFKVDTGNQTPSAAPQRAILDLKKYLTWYFDSFLKIFLLMPMRAQFRPLHFYTAFIISTTVNNARRKSDGLPELPEPIFFAPLRG